MGPPHAPPQAGACPIDPSPTVAEGRTSKPRWAGTSLGPLSVTPQHTSRALSHCLKPPALPWSEEVPPSAEGPVAPQDPARLRALRSPT